MSQNENKSQMKTSERLLHVGVFAFCLTIGIGVTHALVAFLWAPEFSMPSLLIAILAAGLLLVTQGLNAKLDAIKRQLDEMPFEVRRKLYLKRGEAYWPEMDMVVSHVAPSQAGSDPDQKDKEQG